MTVVKGGAPRAHERKVGSSTRVSELVKLEHRIDVVGDRGATKRIQARYSAEPEPKPWWKRLS